MKKETNEEKKMSPEEFNKLPLEEQENIADSLSDQAAARAELEEKDN